MQRFLTFLVLLLLTVPVGLSLQGCANKNSTYCNGVGYGYDKTQPVSINLQPQTTGLSVAFSQTAQLQSPTAENCSGGTASVGVYTYGTSDRTIADVSPTGAVCGGTWNYNTPAVASYTTCIPTGKTGVAYMTAAAGGFTSNQVAVYSHPNVTSLQLVGPTNGAGAPVCLSQGQTSQLDSIAYVTNSAGQQSLLCSPTTNECNNVIGHITYSAASADVVTIDQNGVATRQRARIVADHRKHCSNQQQRRLLLYLPARQDCSERSFDRRHQRESHPEYPPGAHRHGDPTPRGM